MFYICNRIQEKKNKMIQGFKHQSVKKQTIKTMMMCNCMPMHQKSRG